MLDTTLTTIRTILQADTTVPPEQMDAVMEACQRARKPGQRVTARRAAEVLGVHPRTVMRYARDGRLKAIRISRRRIRYDLREVEDLAMNGHAIEKGN